MFSANTLIACSLSYLSLVFSALNLSTNEDDDLTVKLSGLFSRYHQDTIPTVHVNHRQHSCLGLRLGTPHSDTGDELEIHLHTRNLTVVLDLRVPIIFPAVWTDFAPQSIRQESQVVGLYHGPAWWVLRDFQGTALVSSLWTSSVPRSPAGLMFDIFTLTLLPPGNAISHLSPSGARPMQMPLFPFRPMLRTSAANSTLLPSSTRSSSTAMGVIFTPAAGLFSTGFSRRRQHFDIQTVERSLHFPSNKCGWDS